MNTSQELSEQIKYPFTFQHEQQEGVSTHPHHPSFNSGVTIGPGLDLGQFQTPEAALEHLTSLGFDPDTASTLSGAAGLTGDAAQQWVSEHKDVSITPQFEAHLFNELTTPYEQGMYQGLNEVVTNHPEFGLTPEQISPENLTDAQRQAFFDLQYNVAGGVATFPQFVNAMMHGDYERAAVESHRVGLENRNHDFVNEFITPHHPDEQVPADHHQGNEVLQNVIVEPLSWEGTVVTAEPAGTFTHGNEYSWANGAPPYYADPVETGVDYVSGPGINDVFHTESGDNQHSAHLAELHEDGLAMADNQDIAATVQQPSDSFLHSLTDWLSDITAPANPVFNPDDAGSNTVADAQENPSWDAGHTSDWASDIGQAQAPDANTSSWSFSETAPATEGHVIAWNDFSGSTTDNTGSSTHDAPGAWSFAGNDNQQDTIAGPAMSWADFNTDASPDNTHAESAGTQTAWDNFAPSASDNGPTADHGYDASFSSVETSAPSDVFDSGQSGHDTTSVDTGSHDSSSGSIGSDM